MHFEKRKFAIYVTNTWGRVGLDFGKNVTKFYVTNWEGRVGSDPNMYDVTLFTLFFEVFP